MIFPTKKACKKPFPSSEGAIANHRRLLDGLFPGNHPIYNDFLDGKPMGKCWTIREKWRLCMAAGNIASIIISKNTVLFPASD